MFPVRFGGVVQKPAANSGRVWQVMGCHAVEAYQPLFEPTVVSVDVLHMESTIDALTLAKVDGFMALVPFG